MFIELHQVNFYSTSFRTIKITILDYPLRRKTRVQERQNKAKLNGCRYKFLSNTKRWRWPLFSVPEAKTGKLGEGKVAGPREGAEAKGFHGVLTRED